MRPQIVARAVLRFGVAPGGDIGIIVTMNNASVNPARLTEVFSEIVILVLGLLLAIMALSGRFNLPSGMMLWLVLGVVLMIWGVRAWVRGRRFARSSARAMQWIRGGSLVLAGALMIVMIWMPFERAPQMLALVGGILAVRGAIGTALAGRRAMQR